MNQVSQKVPFHPSLRASQVTQKEIDELSTRITSLEKQAEDIRNALLRYIEGKRRAEEEMRRRAEEERRRAEEERKKRVEEERWRKAEEERKRKIGLLVVGVLALLALSRGR